MNNIYGGVYVNLEGVEVERTKHSHPYTYDSFVQWRGGDNSEFNSTVYSDRMRQWDYEKARLLQKKHFGKETDYYSAYAPHQIEAFLKDYLGKEVKLVVIMEHCNQSSGYPLWSFHYHDQTKQS